ncbi:MAG: killer suppression protein HigA [Methylococcales bacterium]
MQINYLDEKLSKLCLNKKEAEKKLGSDCAKKLRSRWSDIEAATNVSELTAGHPHPLEPDSLREFSVELADGKRLVFKPDHEPIPLNNNNTTDWAKVTAITIVYIGDYHKPKQKRK